MYPSTHRHQSSFEAVQTPSPGPSSSPPGLALAGDLADDRDSGTKLAALSMSFGLGTAIGPLASGYLVRFGYEVPFVFGAALAAIGFLLVYTRLRGTVDPIHSDGAESVSNSGVDVAGGD